MAAIALRRFEFDVELFEQATQFRRIGSGIQLAPNAARVLDELGLLKSVEMIGFHPTYRVGRRWDTGEEISRVDVATGAQSRYGAPLLMFHRADLLSVLEKAVPSSRVHFAKQLTGITQSNDSQRSDGSQGKVQLEFSDGTRSTAEAAIGADGIHSIVREVLFGRDKPRFTGVSGFRIIIPSDRAPWYDGSCFTKWFGRTPKSLLLTSLIGSGGTELYVFATKEESEPQRESWSNRGEVEDLLTSYADWHEDARRMLEACRDTAILKTALFDRDPLPRWTVGRVTLLGDACHPMTPFMAQGGAMATEDAVVLARCLDGVSSHEGISDALLRYERSRLVRTAAVQLKSRENEWLAGSGESTDWVYGYDAWRTPLM